MVLLITFVLLYLGWLDYALTSVILAHGGVELNPLLLPIIDTPYFMAVKLGFPLLFGLVLQVTRPKHELGLGIFVKNKRVEWIFRIICFVILAYMVVTGWAALELYRNLV